MADRYASASFGVISTVSREQLIVEEQAFGVRFVGQSRCANIKRPDQMGRVDSVNFASPDLIPNLFP